MIIKNRTAIRSWRTLCAISAAALALSISAVRADTETAEPDAFLDYIEATGSQYIDTGVNAETGLKARIDFAPGAKVKDNDDWSFLDACDGTGGSDTRKRLFLCHLYNEKPFFGYGLKSRGNPEKALTFVRDQRYEIVTDVSDSTAIEVYQNGMKTFGSREPTTPSHTEYSSIGDINLNLNLYIFAGNQSGKPNWYARGKLYELKILKKNTQSGEFDLLRHYLPCVKNGRAGLYDKVNHTISYSSGSAEFVAGPVLDKPLDFVKSITGNAHQWFNTWVWARTGLKSEVDVSTILNTSDRAILASRGVDGTPSNNTRFYMAYHFESVFRFAHGRLPGKSELNAVAVTNDVLSSTHNSVRYLIKTDTTLGSFSMTVSRNGGEPVEVLKKGVDYGSTYLATTNTLYILTNNAGGNPSNINEATLYGVKIWDGNELLRDFVPVVATNSSGVAYAGLYDTVTKRVYKREETRKGKTASDFVISSYQVGAVTNTLRSVAAPKTRLEYADSDYNYDYVDLGVAANAGIELEMAYEWLDMPGERAIVGARDANSKRIYLCSAYNNNWTINPPQHSFHYNASAWTARDPSDQPIGIVANTQFKVKTRVDASAQSITLSQRNGSAWEQIGTRNMQRNEDVQLNIPLYLFSCNDSGIARYPVKARVYSLKLREKQQDGTYALVRNLVPVRDPVTGGAALWDKVTETYFRNGGKYMLAGGGEERPLLQGLAVILR